MRETERNDRLQVVKLMCEYAVNPIGIDTPKPRFTWICTTPENGTRQKAYRILVSDGIELLGSNVATMWDSGVVHSDGSVSVEYGGKPLESRGRYFWNVMVWDDRGQEGSGDGCAWFEMGLLRPSDWKAVWLGFHGSKCGEALLFRREIEVNGTPVKARAYMAGIGYSELMLNGRKVGDSVLDPGFTEYEKRVLYVTHDVTGYLKPGANVIGIQVGNGWYASKALLFQMEVDLADGQKLRFCSETGFFEWSVASGPIQSNSVYDGEIYDAREERTGWERAGYIKYVNERYGGHLDSKTYYRHWTAPATIHGPSGRLVPQLVEPIKVMGDIRPVGLVKIDSDTFVYDMGQNFAGWIRLGVRGPAGTVVTIRYSETVYENGTVNQENLRTALSRDVYVLNGQGEEIYEPRFTYHGFRYVQVEGFPGTPSLENVTGRVVRSSVAAVGRFRCSDDLINRIHSNVVWTETSNLHSIPTDCPQRNERQGWLNDATVRCEETVYNFDMARLLPKWIDDIADAQDPESGAITDTAPFVWGFRPADPVCSSYLNVPWLLYLHYADRRTIEEHYEGFKQWNECLGSLADDCIIEYSTFGDWAPPADVSRRDSHGGSAVSAVTPGSLMSTGYYYYNADLISKMARLLGRHEEAREFDALAARIRNAFNGKFFDRTTANYATGSQSCNVFPVFLDIVPEGYRKRVVENIVNDVRSRGFHLTTGNLCSKYILEVLCEEGYGEDAYRIVTQTTYPSWGYMIDQGATTMWERWEHRTGGEMNSHNHPMYATVGCWFYKYLAGIRPVDSHPGFARVIIKPFVPGELHHVECSLETVKGRIGSSWRKRDGMIEFDISIPFNCNAVLHLPFSVGIRPAGLHEGERLVWTGDRSAGALARGPGIVTIEAMGDAFRVEVNSGSYSFRYRY